MTSGMAEGVICIGSALWDVIARAEHQMVPGYDGPGRIVRQPGGVALNVALALTRIGVPVELLTAIGNDPEGDALLHHISAAGVHTSHITRVPDPTDSYMAIENADGEVFGAVADCFSLELAGDTVLEPLRNGRLAVPARPYSGTAIVDGNLPERILQAMIERGDLAQANRIFVPASPGKAIRLANLVETSGGTLFVNLAEAQIICDRTFTNSRDAATAIAGRGAAAIVTDGPRDATISRDGTTLSVTPPEVEVRMVTGAGDAFLAGFVASDIKGEHPAQSMITAVDTAARYISGKL